MTSPSSPFAPRSTTGGLLRPVLSRLQRRALRLILAFVTVFLLGLGAILWHIVHILPPDLRTAVLSVDGMKLALWAGAAWILLVVLARSAVILYFIRTQVTKPVAELARVSELVGAGELAIPYKATSSNDEVGRLSRATAGMIRDLRNLVGTLRDSAGENDRLALRMTSASQSLAEISHETAMRSDDLSKGAQARQQVINTTVAGANRFTASFAKLREAAQEGLRRERRLRSVAIQNRERLEETNSALDSLTRDSMSSVEAINVLENTVEEIRAFLSLVQKISRQSKLLALNAAMEAARAGEHGEGFAVVADEVRRLAASSAEAAQRTDILVKSMVGNLERSRDSTARTVTAAEHVADAIRKGERSFSQVEYSAREAEEWSARVEDTIAESGQLADSLTGQLHELAKETGEFVRAMQQIAVASDEQSRAIGEIAGGAEDLTRSARKISDLVATFKLEPPAAAGEETSA